MQQIREAISEQGKNSRNTVSITQQPSERWGHCTVAVQKEMFIIGGYHGKFISKFLGRLGCSFGLIRALKRFFWQMLLKLTKFSNNVFN